MSEEPPPYTAPQDFFFKTPLYEPQKMGVQQIKTALRKPMTMDGYCPYCRSASTFHRDRGHERTGYADAYYLALEELRPYQIICARSDNHVIHFFVLLSAAKIQKIGQWPSF